MQMAVLETQKAEQNQMDFQFSRVEASGMIESFDVSETGRIASCISPSSMNLNIYDQYGSYDFTIYTDITRRDAVLHWEEDTLLIYLYYSGISGEEYHLVRVNGYEEYEIFTCPANAQTEKFWSTLEKHTSEQITENGRYYLEYGNLRCEDKQNQKDYAVTENTSFRPWQLLSIPILAAIIWFRYLRKPVREWEAEQDRHKTEKI